MNVRDMYMDNSGTNGKGSQDRVLRLPMMVAPQQTRFDSGVVSLNPGRVLSLAPRDVVALDQELRSINERLARIEQLLLNRSSIANQDCSARIIDDSEAKDEVKRYFEANYGDSIYPDEIAERLGLDLIQVIRVCEELTKEGRLGAGHT